MNYQHTALPIIPDADWDELLESIKELGGTKFSITSCIPPTEDHQLHNEVKRETIGYSPIIDLICNLNEPLLTMSQPKNRMNFNTQQVFYTGSVTGLDSIPMDKLL